MIYVNLSHKSTSLILHSQQLMAKHNEIGQLGEEMAVKFLKAKGYEILETNWRFKKAEIDVIGKQEDTIVFFEVKTRSTDFFGQPEEFVTSQKEAMMADAAGVYCEKVWHDWAIRFDIIDIVLKKNEPVINHFEDAFFPSF